MNRENEKEKEILYHTIAEQKRERERERERRTHRLNA